MYRILMHFSASLPWAAMLLVSPVLIACDGANQTPSVHAEQIEQVVARCTEAMVKSTCQVMSGPAAASSANVVFVAGIGPVDAVAYRELRNGGDAMCEIVRQACRQDWNSPQCSTARSLWDPAKK